MDYLEKNRNSWNQRTLYHLKSDFYDLEGFLKGASSLKSIELDLLGDVQDQSILHLQCHFGQDSLSLARMGAWVTGVDLSDIAIYSAQSLAVQMNLLNAEFICSDVYDLRLNQQFDVVFTSYGVIGWLPDMDRWAEVIARHLKPGGKLVFVEFHPVVWMFNENFRYLQYSYFNKEAIEEVISGTYADPEAPITTETVGWNHSLSEVMGNLLKHGLQIQSFEEFDYSPYNCFSETVEVEPGKFQIQPYEGKIPLVYALKAIKI
ncbi:MULTISPECIES: bifunctional 2-polyprenyl-6-hydroxyphenol methylase/3-demethylubiquinol 3-O-methyltransferase UbiG [unclassified Siphonobacter]|uniref:class I SAM-dependent methyltransferase n=1 Tax=unclassified Siphonobacter TaxID=2635712 RepID=UPI000CA6670B|nr:MULTISPECIES: class I SAM-dependent methyltransferase [unclassified Siphonobacter]MDQ1085774.1 2-polyprenyl-3-methyl-5-hydroxy-6-metoxy-1,4-benzoquinol methylase [Siphonobacter sp. SORGH_AS_1065]PKK35620.1 SAM-dependent methyltransferase [Siphonobacter sp. SORGH_AS_0500]